MSSNNSKRGRGRGRGQGRNGPKKEPASLFTAPPPGLAPPSGFQSHQNEKKDANSTPQIAPMKLQRIKRTVSYGLQKQKKNESQTNTSLNKLERGLTHKRKLNEGIEKMEIEKYESENDHGYKQETTSKADNDNAWKQSKKKKKKRRKQSQKKEVAIEKKDRFSNKRENDSNENRNRQQIWNNNENNFDAPIEIDELFARQKGRSDKQNWQNQNQNHAGNNTQYGNQNQRFNPVGWKQKKQWANDRQKENNRKKWKKGRDRKFAKKESTEELNKLSRKLTGLLRHRAKDEGFDIRPDGYVPVDDIVDRYKYRVSMKGLKWIVENDSKTRFNLIQEDGEYLIRANQGHSMEGINANEIFDPIYPGELDVCIHGTYFKFWNSIRDTGLNKMGRLHIHFTPSEVVTEDARSGFRKSCDIIIYLDVEKALQDGLKLFRSANNVILSPGFKGGIIPSRYFLCVKERHTGRIIFTNRQNETTI